MGSVRIGPDDEHPGLGVLLEDLGVADGLGSHDMALLLPVQPDPLLLGELPLLDFQFVGDREEPLLDPLLAHHLVQEGQVVAEEDDRVGIEHLRVGPQLLLEEDRRHGRHVLVREADVRAEEARFAGFGPLRPDLVGGGVDDPLAGEDLLAEGHGAGGVGGWHRCDAGGGVRAPGCSDGTVRPRRRQRHLPLQPGHVELEEPAVFDDLPGDLVGACGELRQRNALAGADSLDQAEVGGGENAQVLAVLIVDALDALADDDLDPRHQLGVRALFPAGALAAALPRHRADEATRLHGAAFDRRFVPSVRTGDLQTQVREVAQRLVVEETDVCRGDLVGADLVAQSCIQLGRQLQVQPIVELPSDQLGVVSEVEDAAAEGDFRWPFFDLRHTRHRLSATFAPKWRTNCR